MPQMDPRQRYLNDAGFHELVDRLASALGFTSADLRAAVELAIEIRAERSRPPHAGEFRTRG